MADMKFPIDEKNDPLATAMLKHEKKYLNEATRKNIERIDPKKEYPVARYDKDGEFDGFDNVPGQNLRLNYAISIAYLERKNFDEDLMALYNKAIKDLPAYQAHKKHSLSELIELCDIPPESKAITKKNLADLPNRKPEEVENFTNSLMRIAAISQARREVLGYYRAETIIESENKRQLERQQRRKEYEEKFRQELQKKEEEKKKQPGQKDSPVSFDAPSAEIAAMLQREGRILSDSLSLNDDTKTLSVPLRNVTAAIGAKQGFKIGQ